MRKNQWWNRSTQILAALLFLLAGAIQLQAQDDCSVHSLQGAFGFRVTGINTALQAQFAVTGRFVADGEGSVTGIQLESVNGFQQPTTFHATYQVNPDCTGISVFTFQNGIVAHLFFVLVDDGNEVIIMDADLGTVETGTAKKQFPVRRQNRD